MLFVIRYQTDATGFQARSDRYGTYLQFASQVEVLTTHYSITTITLVTRIGGIIGVGKELLWVIIFAVNFLVTLPNILGFVDKK